MLLEYLAHYNAARPHQALELRTPQPRGRFLGPSGEIVRHDRLGGLIHEYERQAA
jgi:hypothetical protein